MSCCAFLCHFRPPLILACPRRETTVMTVITFTGQFQSLHSFFFLLLNCKNGLTAYTGLVKEMFPHTESSFYNSKYCPCSGWFHVNIFFNGPSRNLGLPP